jgi:hypothetical protein
MSFEEFSNFSSETESIVLTPESSEFGTCRDTRDISLGYGYSLKSETEIESISYDAFMADSQRKRRRIENVISEDKGIKNRSSQKKSTPKKVKRRVRELYEIIGREGLSPIKYRDLTNQFRCDLSLLEIL